MIFWTIRIYEDTYVTARLNVTPFALNGIAKNAIIWNKNNVVEFNFSLLLLLLGCFFDSNHNIKLPFKFTFNPCPSFLTKEFQFRHTHMYITKFKFNSCMCYVFVQIYLRLQHFMSFLHKYILLDMLWNMKNRSKRVTE